jgi:hypothetical protein
MALKVNFHYVFVAFLHRFYSDDDKLSNDHVFVAFKRNKLVRNFKIYSLIKFWYDLLVVGPLGL